LCTVPPAYCCSVPASGVDCLFSLFFCLFLPFRHCCISRVLGDCNQHGRGPVAACMLQFSSTVPNAYLWRYSAPASTELHSVYARLISQIVVPQLDIFEDRKLSSGCLSLHSPYIHPVSSATVMPASTSVNSLQLPRGKRAAALPQLACGRFRFTYKAMDCQATDNSQMHCQAAPDRLDFAEKGAQNGIQASWAASVRYACDMLLRRASAVQRSCAAE
jgi:hypothetical protein